ncbi:MAG TPA: translation elongation factor Ts [Candidatus Aminicenantes bacterium]|nr:translation elongation factor Ts [Candidatus Aminicenantes bacterium]
MTAKLVNELRQITGIGMMDCKEALQESDGDIEKAITYLRKKGYDRAKDKMGRETTEGVVGSYIHSDNKLGVLVEVNCESDFVARNEEFKELVKNLSLHIAAANPKYITSEEIPEDVIEKEKEIILEQYKDSDKPPEILERIVEGKLKKFYSEVCLWNQPYIKDDKITIEKLVSTYITKFGENIKINRFARFSIGRP